MSKSLKLHEYWRKNYRIHRYCEHLGKDELDQRISNIMLNLIRLTPEAKVGLPPISQEGERWMELFTHTLEEMRLRYGNYPNGFTRDIFEKNPIPDFAGKLANKAVGVLKEKNLRQGMFFIKYGRREFMRRLYEEGSVRIQSASYYNAVDHNGAIRDDELSLAMSLHLTRSDLIKLVENPEAVPPDLESQRVDLSHFYQSDYWLYCVTESLQPRLFVDFDANACVVVRDRAEFITRLKENIAGSIQDVSFQASKAMYVDPLLPSGAFPDLPISKHFKYTYQQEFRFVWEPRDDLGTLNHIDVDLGSISDIAELITL